MADSEPGLHALSSLPGSGRQAGSQSQSSKSAGWTGTKMSSDSVQGAGAISMPLTSIGGEGVKGNVLETCCLHSRDHKSSLKTKMSWTSNKAFVLLLVIFFMKSISFS